MVNIVASGGGGFNDNKGFQGREHGGKKLSVVVGESVSYITCWEEAFWGRCSVVRNIR